MERLFFRAALLNPDDNLPLMPQLLQPIAFALGGGEQVDDDTAKIHQHPTAGRLALHPGRFAAVFLAGHVIQRVGQRVELAFATAGTDDEIISKTGLDVHVQQDDVFRLFVFERVYQ